MEYLIYFLLFAAIPAAVLIFTYVNKAYVELLLFLVILGGILSALVGMSKLNDGGDQGVALIGIGLFALLGVVFAIIYNKKHTELSETEQRKEE